MDVILEGSPISTEDLWSSLRMTIRFLVTSLTKALLCQFLNLGPSMLQTFFGTLPQICASTQSCLGALQTIPLASWLGFCSDMHCQLQDLIQTGVFPNHVQSIEFTTGGLPSCRNISRMINGNRMHLSSISSLLAKGLNSYVTKVCFQIIIFLILAKMCF